MKDHVLVFVPGILGSELFYNGPSRNGNLLKQAVWTGDVAALFDTLAFSPELLHINTPLTVGKILDRLRLSWVKRIDVYRPLLEFFVAQLGYTPEVDFFPYAYDWRQTNTFSADLLATTLRSRFSEDLPIKFVVHSMGGVIVRLLLSNGINQDLVARTRGFVQIGVPARGSSKAFRTLKHSPAFGGLFDHLLSLMHRMDPALHTRLLSVLNSFPSLFELMPPESEHIAVNEADYSYSALYKSFWPTVRDAELDSVRRVQMQLSSPPLSCSLAIYSSDVVTERDYLVDENFVFRNVVQRVVRGDGTVSIGSAILGIDAAKCFVVEGGVPHDKLPNDGKRVWRVLKEELNK